MDFSPEQDQDIEPDLLDIVSDILSFNPFQFIGVVRGESAEIVSFLYTEIEILRYKQRLYKSVLYNSIDNQSLSDDQSDKLETSICFIEDRICDLIRDFFRVSGYSYRNIYDFSTRKYVKNNKLFPFFIVEVSEKDAVLVFSEVIPPNFYQEV